MTLEQTTYELKPYVIAFLGLYALSMPGASFANTCGGLLLWATFLIGTSRYRYRYLNASKSMLRKRVKSKPSKSKRITRRRSQKVRIK
jgi:hypothetical protein